MKKIKNLSYVNIFIFVIIILTFSFINLIYPKNQTISQTENRTLAKKPDFTVEALFSGEYFRNFESYFSDHFPFREKLVSMSKELSALKGIKGDKEVYLVDFNGQNVGGNQDEDTDGSNSAQASTKDNLLILNDTVMEIYKFHEDKSKYYANMINKIQDKIGTNTKIYSLLAPVQIEFLKDKKYKNLSDSQLDAINFVKKNLNKGITSVDAYSPIKEHIDEYVYFRTDHHWTALGAYYAYTGFAKAAEFDPIPLDKFKTRKASGFLGYLSTVNPSERVNNNPDDIIYYIPPVKSNMKVYYYDKDTGEKKSYNGAVISKSYIKSDQKYGVFIGGDFPLGVIKTKANSDKNILVIKDSYGNSFIPFLVPHYSEIYVVDPRHYKESVPDLIKENNIDEVMILNYVLTTNFNTYVDNVLNLFK